RSRVARSFAACECPKYYSAATMARYASGAGPKPKNARPGGAPICRANPHVADLFLALVHHPVLDRNGRIVTSAITSLDIHDLARSACTFGVRAFFIVHPVAEQRHFAATVIDHWKFDFGRAFYARRRAALELVLPAPDPDASLATAEQLSGTRPLVLHTSARTERGESFAGLRARITPRDSPPLLILLGTGFGLAPELAQRSDLIAQSIRGVGAYNHLSVRAAGAIILERLRAP